MRKIRRITFGVALLLLLSAVFPSFVTVTKATEIDDDIPGPAEETAFDYDIYVGTLLAAGDFFERLGKDNRFDEMTDDEKYQFQILAKYEFANNVIRYGGKDNIRLEEQLGTYKTIAAASVTSVEREEMEAEALNTLVSQVRDNEKENIKSFSDYETYLLSYMDKARLTSLLEALDGFPADAEKAYRDTILVIGCFEDTTETGTVVKQSETPVMTETESATDTKSITGDTAENTGDVLSAVETAEEPAITTMAAETPSVIYAAKPMYENWPDTVSDGVTAGRTGVNQEIDGIKIGVSGDENLGIKFIPRYSGIGWQSWISDGSGSCAAGRDLQAIRIELTGTDAEKYSVFYRTHVENYGWLDWANDGRTAGSTGKELRLEAIEIQILPKGQEPGSMARSYVANYAARIGSSAYETLKDAVDNASNGDTIYICNDCAIDENIFCEKDITIKPDVEDMVLYTRGNEREFFVGTDSNAVTVKIETNNGHKIIFDGEDGAKCRPHERGIGMVEVTRGNFYADGVEFRHSNHSWTVHENTKFNNTTTFENCYFHDNQGCYGGWHSVYANNCVFENNTGACFHIRTDIDQTKEVANISNCIFTKNASPVQVANRDPNIGTTLYSTISDCIFTTNNFNDIYVSSYSVTNMDVKNCELTGNGERGIYTGNANSVINVTDTNIKNCAGNGIESGSQMSITGGELSGNNRNTDNNGAAINNLTGGNLTINEGIIIKNNSTTAFGGAIYNAPGAGMAIYGGTITGNAAPNGGAIYNDGTLVLEGDAVITRNTSSASGNAVYQNGAMIMRGNSKVALDNDIYLPAGKFVTVDSAITDDTATAAILTPDTYADGRTMVKVAIDGEKASDEYVYAGTSAAKFAITPQGRYTLRPGDYIDASRSVAKTDIVISEAYKVTYDQNTSNTAALSNMPATTAKYWYEAGQISAAVPVWDGVKFLGWDEAADCETPKYNAGDFIPADQNRDITLYAKWEDKILVVYDGNGNTNAAAVGTEKTTFVTKQQIDLAGGYTVEKNTGNTDFEKTGTTYVGWDEKKSTSAVNVTYKETKNYTMSWDALKDQSERQSDTAQTSGKAETTDNSQSVASRVLSLFAAPAYAGDKDTAGVATFYATYDTPPILNSSAPIEVYEGATVTKNQLLDGVSASDTEDGDPLDIGKIHIVRVDYAEGKLVDNVKQPASTDTWSYESPMSEDYTVDTWLSQFAEEDSPVTHTVTFEVRDSAGNAVTATRQVIVKYNNYPEIQAEDRYFSLDEARKGLITEAELRSRLTASDIEDGDLTDQIELRNFNADEFKSFTDKGYVVIKTKVKDSMGKETYRDFKVGVEYEGLMETGSKYVRFINQKNYEKNADVTDPGSLSKEEKQTRNANGGLNVYSVWYMDPDYRNLITETLNGKSFDSVWKFTRNDIQIAKDYIKEYGIGNSQNQNEHRSIVSSYEINKE